MRGRSIRFILSREITSIVVEARAVIPISIPVTHEVDYVRVAGDDNLSGVSADVRLFPAAFGGARVQLHRPDPSVSRIPLTCGVMSYSAAPERPLPNRRGSLGRRFLVSSDHSHV